MLGVGVGLVGSVGLAARQWPVNLLILNGRRIVLSGQYLTLTVGG
jgi:hypothetical protein